VFNLATRVSESSLEQRRGLRKGEEYGLVYFVQNGRFIKLKTIPNQFGESQTSEDKSSPMQKCRAKLSINVK